MGMRVAVECASRTGNTERLAERARELVGDGLVKDAGEADVVLLGSWCYKGSLAEEELPGELDQLAGSRVFLFGTCGFGGSEEYYERVLDRYEAALPQGCEVVGRFMCQGQMPPSVRERYVEMAERDPARFQPMIENFDRALGHPDESDLAAFEAALRAAGVLG